MSTNRRGPGDTPPPDTKDVAGASAERLFLNSIVENIPHMIFVKDAEDLRFVLFNRAGEQLLGTSRDQLIGRNDYDFFPPEQADFFTAKDREVLERGEVLDIPEEPIETPHGKRFLYTKKIPLRDEQDRARFLLGISLDITARKQADEELRRAKEAAEAANRAKSQFLATISHEIRTPLNGVIGMCDLLLETTLDRKQCEYAKTVQVSAGHLMRLLDDILDLTRIEAGGLVIEPSSFSVRELVDEVLQVLSHRAQQRKLRLRCELSAQVPSTVVGDAARLRQILFNLAGNAIKFTDEGSVCIAIDLAEQREDELVLCFTIRDTGIGIAAEDLAGIFDSFTQVDGTTRRRHGGAGLGLAISKRLCDLMGGTIDVSSEKGRGSEFRVSLPLRRVDQPSASPTDDRDAPTDRPAPPSTASERILVVEDNPINQKVAVAMLERLGYGVHVVDGGIDALEVLARDRFDAVLMDCEMPGLDGFETTRVLRERETTGIRIPIVAVTANSMTGDRERCLAAGMDDYLAKPVTLTRLQQTLQRWLVARGGAEPL